MAEKGDPLKEIKSKAKNVVDGFLDNLVENKVVDKRTLQNLGSGISNVIAGTQTFIKRFAEQNQDKIHLVVSNSNKQLSLQFTNIQDTPSVVELVESVDNLNLCPYEEYQNLSKTRAGEIYPIMKKGSRTRLALIICNTVFKNIGPRDGAERDIAEMKKLLESLDYTVHVKKQLTAKEMESALKDFAKRSEHSTSDSMFLVLMSHGLLEGICGTMHSDDQPDMLSYDTVFSIFNNRNCSHLKDKPKVLIIQACRGKSSGVARVPDCAAWTDSPMPLLENLQEDSISRTHIEKDFIAFYSSTPHNMSWRDTEMGSPFITQIVTHFKKYACRLHLEEIFRKVKHSFEKTDNNIQMPTIERNSLTKDFYLFPGH